MRVTAIITVVCATSCTNGATSSTPTVAPANIAGEAKLQLALGTATIGYPGGTFTGTNFVSTFRGSDGHSATLQNTPTITGPPNFVIGFQGSLNTISGVLPNVFNQAVRTASSSTPNTALPLSLGASLGPLVGVFGYGMAADNLLSSQVSLQFDALNHETNLVCEDLISGTGAEFVQGSPPIAVPGVLNGVQLGNSGAPASSIAQSNELPLPVGILQSNTAKTSCPLSPLAGVPITPATSNYALPINYYGGPPAWPSAQGYGQPTFFVGYPLGFTDFATAPVAGKYSLDVAYPTNQTSTTYGHFDATATLRSTSALPALTIASATVISDGSGSVVLTVPSGVTETIVFVRAIDCTTLVTFDNYAVISHSIGRQVFTFGANLGPPNGAGQPASTFCPGADGGFNANAYAVGFDYPAYESSYPFNVTQTPQITGSNGQADVTTSAPVSFTSNP